jgi:predicted ATPase
MKILHFYAKKVHGIYNFDFDFHRDVTFLVGINGSGKTSALRLMQAALTLDLSALYSIKFAELSLTIERDGRAQTIRIKNEGNSLSLFFSKEDDGITLPLLSEEEKATYTKNGRLDEHLDEMRLHILRTIPEEGRRLISGEKPLFLGLERRTGRYDDEFNYTDDERNVKYRIGMRREMRDGLESCQSLIERSYRQFRRISDTSNSRLISVIIGSTFDYIKFDPETIEAGQMSSYQELQELLLRRQELEKFALDLGGGNTLSEQIDQFFRRITAIFTDETPRNSFSIELLMNKVQIQRFHKILAELDRQKKNAERVYAPIRRFVDSMNRFFDQSRKNVDVDSIGRLRIIQGGDAIPAQSLSSGEKQLLILMAHATLSRNKGGVFIVDEPELSLHLRWQEMLIGELMSTNKDNQFIFATHSPEIVGYLKQHCVDVG